MTIEEMRAAVAAEDARLAAEAEAKRLAYLAPVQELCTSAAYAEVVHKCEDMLALYEDDGTFNIHVQAISEILPRLAGIANVSVQPRPVAEVD